MLRMRLAMVATCLLTTSALPAQSIRYVAQERSVRASVSDEYYSEEGTVRVGDADRVDATDFGPFDARASAKHNDPVYPSGYSNISQRSTLDQTGIEISGEWSNQAFTDNGGFTFATTLVATFDVLDQPVAYDLIYLLQAPSYERWGHEVDLSLQRLDGQGGDVFRIVPDYDANTDVASGEASGVLAPGRYAFRYAEDYLGSVGDHGEHEVGLTFAVVPEPGAGLMALAGLSMLMGRRRRNPE